MEVYIFISLYAVAFGMSGDYWDPMENDNLFEGDILFDPYELTNGVPGGLSHLWSGGTVRYEIDLELCQQEPLISSVMKYLEDETCIRFKKKGEFDIDYVHIYRGNGCFSTWGRKGGKQELSLGDGCHLFPIILHELMHTIGLEHEHNRSDRDDHVIINWNNIVKEFHRVFYKLKPEENKLLTEFDDHSIMLFGSRFYAKEPNSNKYSMVRKDGSYIEAIYDKTSMTRLDAKKVNLLYLCKAED